MPVAIFDNCCGCNCEVHFTAFKIVGGVFEHNATAGAEAVRVFLRDTISAWWTVFDGAGFVEVTASGYTQYNRDYGDKEYIYMETSCDGVVREWELDEGGTVTTNYTSTTTSICWDLYSGTWQLTIGIPAYFSPARSETAYSADKTTKTITYYDAGDVVIGEYVQTLSQEYTKAMWAADLVEILDGVEAGSTWTKYCPDDFSLLKIPCTADEGATFNMAWIDLERKRYAATPGDLNTLDHLCTHIYTTAGANPHNEPVAFIYSSDTAFSGGRLAVRARKSQYLWDAETNKTHVCLYEWDGVSAYAWGTPTCGSPTLKNGLMFYEPDYDGWGGFGSLKFNSGSGCSGCP